MASKFLGKENSSRMLAAKICYLDKFCFTKYNSKTFSYLYFQILEGNISLNNSDSINLFTLIVDYIESSVVNPFGVPADVALHSSSPYHHRKGT